MTLGGWISMILSVGAVTVLFTWCITRVLFKAPAKHLHGLDIDTRDTGDEG